MNDNCLFCDYPACDICPFGDRDYDDIVDIYPEFLFECHHEREIFPECFEYHGERYE